MSVSETHSHPIVDCQVCSSKNLRSLLFLGYVPPVNTMPPVGERAVEQPAFPLELLRCDDCGLVQIGLEVAPEVLFPYSYPYLSGTTRILRDNFADLYTEATSLAAARIGRSRHRRRLQRRHAAVELQEGRPSRARHRAVAGGRGGAPCAASTR